MVIDCCSEIVLIKCFRLILIKFLDRLADSMAELLSAFLTHGRRCKDGSIVVWRWGPRPGTGERWSFGRHEPLRVILTYPKDNAGRCLNAHGVGIFCMHGVLVHHQGVLSMTLLCKCLDIVNISSVFDLNLHRHHVNLH